MSQKPVPLKINTKPLKNLFWYGISHAFLSIVILIMATLLLGAFLFYHYSLPASPDALSPAIETKTQFRYDTYQQILAQWQLQDQSLVGLDNQNQTNPFGLPPPTPTP